MPIRVIPSDERRIRGKASTADPLQSAIRIAAALNAEDRPDRLSPGFLWATGVTTDGQILVANSYGLGYIPAGQKLPRQVRMVTVDDSVPVTERVSWVSRPWRALAGWARAKNVGLGTVVGTEQQLRDIEIEVPQTTLVDGDIPRTSQMAGIDRLELIAPAQGKRLAATVDGRLATLLPPPLADAAEPMSDRSAELWSAVGRPLMSAAQGREIVQLQAVLDYADHCEELAIRQAYAAGDPIVQRAAIADGLYWHHLARLTLDVLNGHSSLS